MRQVFSDLYQAGSYVQPINLSFNQFLINSSGPLLVHTGNMEQARKLIAPLKKVLNGKSLNYIFVSHFESDECGGLSLILAEYPDAKVICSEVTARQLQGFGIAANTVTINQGGLLSSDDYELEFILYPSEMHLWNGLLLFERKRRVFFSSDLMIRFGEPRDIAIESTWEREIQNITDAQIPDRAKREELQNELRKLNPLFIATGHGDLIHLKEN